MALYTLPLREALNDSISSGRFADTKIVLFSRRDSSGTVCKPRALYASSHVLRTVPYFNDRKSLQLFQAVARLMTSFKCFLEHLRNPSRRISQNHSMMLNPPRIMAITLTVILRRTRIPSARRQRNRRRRPGVTSSTLSVFYLPPTTMDLPVVSTRKILRQGKS